MTDEQKFNKHQVAIEKLVADYLNDIDDLGMPQKLALGMCALNTVVISILSSTPPDKAEKFTEAINVPVLMLDIFSPYMMQQRLWDKGELEQYIAAVIDNQRTKGIHHG